MMAILGLQRMLNLGRDISQGAFLSWSGGKKLQNNKEKVLDPSIFYPVFIRDPTQRNVLV